MRNCRCGALCMTILLFRFSPIAYGEHAPSVVRFVERTTQASLNRRPGEKIYKLRYPLGNLLSNTCRNCTGWLSL